MCVQAKGQYGVAAVAQVLSILFLETGSRHGLFCCSGTVYIIFGDRVSSWPVLLLRYCQHYFWRQGLVMACSPAARLEGLSVSQLLDYKSALTSQTGSFKHVF